MTVIARFEVIPVRDGSMSTAIASALRALDQYPVSYETTATDTIIEAETVEDVFAAVQAAHRAIPDDRVITSVEIDEDRRRPQAIHERVASVERELGYPPQRHQHPAPHEAPPRARSGASGQPTQGQAAGQPTEGQAPGQPTEMQPSGQSMEMEPSGQPIGARQTAQPMQGHSSGQQFQGRPSGQSVQRQPSGQPIQNQPSGQSVQRQPSEQPTRPNR